MARQHYEQMLHELQEELMRMASLVESAIVRSIEALKNQDVDLAQHVIHDDDLIDQAQYALEERALLLLATQQPMARDLRGVSAAISIASELERMGDYAEGIAEITIRGANQPLLKPLIDVPRMADLAQGMLHRALDAYLKGDVELAYALNEADTQVDQLTDQVQNELLHYMVRDPQNIERAIHLLYVAHNLERIADRATNIGERVVFMATGKIVELNR